MTELKEISMDDIVISSSNTRKDLQAGSEDSSIENLAESIKEKGLLNPITVMKNSDGKFEIIAGQRRYLACKLLKMKTIPALVRESMTNIDATIISLIENVHRADMNPIDKANAFKKILDKYSGNENSVAKETGLSVGTIKTYLKLLRLSPELQERVSTSDGHTGIQTLSRIATDFDESEQVNVLEEVGGFNQRVQLEILKASQGNFEKLSEYREKALEGAFDQRICRGLNECSFLDEEEIEFLEKYREYRKNNPDKKEDFASMIRKLKY